MLRGHLGIRRGVASLRSISRSILRRFACTRGASQVDRARLGLASRGKRDCRCGCGFLAKGAEMTRSDCGLLQPFAVLPRWIDKVAGSCLLEASMLLDRRVTLPCVVRE